MTLPEQVPSPQLTEEERQVVWLALAHYHASIPPAKQSSVKALGVKMGMSEPLFETLAQRPLSLRSD